MIKYSEYISQFLISCLVAACLGWSSQVLGATLIHDFETSRLKSTAGAGVGSILMDEATILNPAPLAFYKVGSVYLQKSGLDISSNDSSNLRPRGDSDQLGVIISDTKAGLSGSVSFFKLQEGFNKRKRASFSLASPVGKKSAFGLTFRHTKDTLSLNGLDEIEQKYNQVNFGIIHSVSERFSLGFVAIDPFKAKRENTRGLIGGQYVFSNFITLMGDIGADYNQNLSDTAIFRGALQARLWNDFFLRFGVFDDKARSEKGNGIGLGWVQPKLVIELALKNTDVKEVAIGDANKDQEEENIKETSLSLSYRF